MAHGHNDKTTTVIVNKIVSKLFTGIKHYKGGLDCGASNALFI